MRYLILCMVLCSFAFGEVLWEWDFQEVPSGWTSDNWEFSSSGAYSSVSVSASGPYSNTETSLMESEEYVVPAGVTYLEVTVTTDWDLSGWWSAGESYCYIDLTFISGSLTFNVVHDSRSWGFMDSEETRSDITMNLMLPEGSPFTITASSYATACYGAGATAEWTISNLVICDQNGVALSRNSWGAIKNSF